VGSLLLAGAIVVALVTAAYVVGYQRAEAVLTRAFNEERFEIASTARPNDPLARPAEAIPAAAGSAVPPEERPRGRSDGGWGAVEPPRDPRVPGRHYFILMETAPAGAHRVAEFCRKAGLEAYVVPANNDRLRKVIAFPGFEDRSSPEVTQLRNFIAEVGERWSRVERSASSFGAYLSLYRE
jgi:hypothetical protein